MKKKNLEKMINSAYKSETPDLRSRILESCKKEPQEIDIEQEIRNNTLLDRLLCFTQPMKRIAAVAICFVLLVVGITLGMLISHGNESVEPTGVETIVYLDVNPSIELHIDRENKVIDCIPSNEDAEIILSALDLERVSLNTALNAIIGSMYVNGYIAEYSNSILISVASMKEDTPDSFLLDVTKNINSLFDNLGMECAIIAQCVSIDDELKLGAEQYGISVGKMHLLRKISDNCGGLSADNIDVLSGLSIKDLNLIYSQKPNNGNQNGYELIYGEVNVGITKDKAITLILNHLGKDDSDISDSHCIYRISRYDDTRVVYAVTLKFNDDSKVYRYEVDCQSGEVSKIENKTKK